MLDKLLSAWSLCVHKRFFVVIALFVVCFSQTTAQTARFRAQIDPLRQLGWRNPNAPAGTDPTLPRSRWWRYADLTADGNLAVMGSLAPAIDPADNVTKRTGAFIFDISNPDAPVLKAQYGIGQHFLEAVIVGKRAYFGSGSGSQTGVHIVDLTNPSNPVLLGTVTAANANGYNRVHEIFVDGDFLYENLDSLSTPIIKVINIKNPANPVFVRDIVPMEVRWIHGMFVKNGRMFTSGWGNESANPDVPGLVEIFDITKIGTENARPLGSIATGINTHSIWTSEDGNYMYVCRELFDGQLRVYDIRNVSNPLLVKVITAGDLGINAFTPHNPVVKGNRLFVAWYQAGTIVFDITNPADPKRIATYDTYLPEFNAEAAKKETGNLKLQGIDLVCGGERLSALLPNSYDGNWTGYATLGTDKVVLSDMNSGFYIIDFEPNHVADFDSDGKSDLSTWNEDSGIWTFENSSSGVTNQIGFGQKFDNPIAQDYDGDGKTDVAVTRTNQSQPTDNSLVWYILNSRDNGYRVDQFGLKQDIPVRGDFDGDGRADLAVFRPSEGVWYIQQSTLGFRAEQWGVNGDLPVPGDFDGDGKTDIAVVRKENGFRYWYILQSSDGKYRFEQFGIADNESTVLADFDGDQKTDLGVRRINPNDGQGTFYILNSSNNNLTVFQFGTNEDAVAASDFDGDNKADIAVYRTTTNVWYGLKSTTGEFFVKQATVRGIPVPATHHLTR
ncbi:MAG: VCBS repeat-containing protein [Pyrinomonadaceae bacterium]|nr:VCBS repeat-containing protein [Pyrinomonadaceae bacterium]